MASLGLVQLDRYPSLLDRRKEIVDRYDRGLQVLSSILWHTRLKLSNLHATSTSPM